MGTSVTLAIVYVCGDPECREPCVAPAAEPDAWQHRDGPRRGTPPCADPERREVAPYKGDWDGATWRLYEAREAARAANAVKARTLTEGAEAGVFGFDGRIKAALDAAWNAGHAFAVAERQRERIRERT